MKKPCSVHFQTDLVAFFPTEASFRLLKPATMPMLYQNILIQLGQEIWATSIAFVVAVTIAVALRFLTKSVTKLGLDADDWWILVAYVLFIPQQALELHGE